MNCVKCGRKKESTDAFCSQCLAGMEKYPIKPGTAVYIPVRSAATERKQTWTPREKTPEEQTAFFYNLSQGLFVCVLALATTLAVSIGMLAFALTDEIPQETEAPQEPSRRNYTTTAPQNVD